MRFFHPYLVFLSEDPTEAARFSTTPLLCENIRQTCQVLTCVMLYVFGIRSKKIHKFMFSKAKKDETMRRYFREWPLKSSPTFTLYNPPEARWARQCKNHYDYLVAFLEANIDEYQFRTGCPSPAEPLLEYFQLALYEAAFDNRVSLPEVKNLKIVLPWKNLPLDCRKKNIVEGYRKWFLRGLGDPFLAYAGTKRDIPEFVFGKEPIA